MARKSTLDWETRRWLKGDDNFGVLTYDVVGSRAKCEVYVHSIQVKEQSIILNFPHDGHFSSLLSKIEWDHDENETVRFSNVKSVPTTSSIVTSQVGLMFFNFWLERSPLFIWNRLDVQIVRCHFDSMKLVDVKEKQDKIRRHMLDEL